MILNETSSILYFCGGCHTRFEPTPLKARSIIDLSTPALCDTCARHQSNRRSLAREIRRARKAWDTGEPSAISLIKNAERSTRTLGQKHIRLAAYLQSKRKGWERETETAAREDYIIEHTPTDYLAFDINKAPDPAATLRAINLHTYDDTRPFVILVGTRGTGKTTAAFHLAGAWTRVNGTRWRHVDSAQAQDAFLIGARNGTVEEQVSELLSADALILDDVGHGSFSASFALGLRRLVERARGEQYPLIITLQNGADELRKKAAARNPELEDVMEAIVTRLQRHGRIIRFGKPKAKS